MKLYTNLFLFLALISLCGDTAASQTSISNAVVTLRKIIIDVPSDPVALQIYEKKQAMPIVQCAKIVYDTVYAQILETLQDIDNRLAYWQDRKNHPWKYFFTKNPLKWVTGVPQNVEVEDNIEQLQSNQGELYVLLGQLAEHGNVYDREYKTIFVADYTKAYAWVDGLLDLLPRIKVPVKNLGDMSPFLARVTLLKAKLEKVRFFKNQILAEMKDTQIPATLERNWLKYSAAGLFLGLGYNHAGQIGEFAAGSFDWTKNYMFETAHSINQFFFPPK